VLVEFWIFFSLDSSTFFSTPTRVADIDAAHYTVLGFARNISVAHGTQLREVPAPRPGGQWHGVHCRALPSGLSPPPPGGWLSVPLESAG